MWARVCGGLEQADGGSTSSWAGVKSWKYLLMTTVDTYPILFVKITTYILKICRNVISLPWVLIPNDNGEDENINIMYKNENNDKDFDERNEDDILLIVLMTTMMITVN